MAFNGYSSAVNYQTLKVGRTGPALTIAIDREDARNAINPLVMREIVGAVDTAISDESVRVIVLTGAGERAFCAGGDLAGGMASGAVAQHLDRAMLSTLFRTLRTAGKPIIARVNGHALGGGFGLMLACDLVVAKESAEVGTPEINIGLWPYIITSVIQRNLPAKLAIEMMMLGRRIKAAEAERWGMINRVVSDEDLDRAVDELVGELASKSPMILKLGKDSFYAASDMDFDSSLSYLESQLSIGLMAEDAIEGVQAFIQKRPPEWKGR